MKSNKVVFNKSFFYINWDYDLIFVRYIIYLISKWYIDNQQNVKTEFLLFLILLNLKIFSLLLFLELLL